MIGRNDPNPFVTAMRAITESECFPSQHCKHILEQIEKQFPNNCVYLPNHYLFVVVVPYLSLSQDINTAQTNSNNSKYEMQWIGIQDVLQNVLKGRRSPHSSPSSKILSSPAGITHSPVADTTTNEQQFSLHSHAVKFLRLAEFKNLLFSLGILPTRRGTPIVKSPSRHYFNTGDERGHVLSPELGSKKPLNNNTFITTSPNLQRQTFSNLSISELQWPKQNEYKAAGLCVLARLPSELVGDATDVLDQYAVLMCHEVRPTEKNRAVFNIPGGKIGSFISFSFFISFERQ